MKSKKMTQTSKKLEIVVLLLVLGVLIIIFEGCATTVKTRMLVPAKASEAAKIRRVAVLPFAGPTGNQVSVDIEALLVGVRVKDKPFFSIIERNALEKIMEEQKLQLYGLVDEKTAAKVGKLTGAEGIILGTVTQCTTEDKSYSQERSKCVSKDAEGRCTKRSKYKVSCTERNAYFSFTPKMVNVTTGKIVASESLSGKSKDNVCQDSNRPLRGKKELLTQAKNQAIEKFREMVAPYCLTVEIKLLDKDDTKMSSEVKEKIARGIKWAKIERLDRACEFWHEAYDLHPKGYAIPYLLGVCAEISGDLEKALSYYEKADRNTGSPVKEISEALGRVRVSIEKQKKLDEQLNR
jgi:hypothetical protein